MRFQHAPSLSTGSLDGLIQGCLGLLHTANSKRYPIASAQLNGFLVQTYQSTRDSLFLLDILVRVWATLGPVTHN